MTDIVCKCGASRLEDVQCAECGEYFRARWIPVSERLPEDNGTGISEPVLTIYMTPYALSAETIRALLPTGMWYDCCTGILSQPKNVTHWMPLPEPPEAE